MTQDKDIKMNKYVKASKQAAFISLIVFLAVAFGIAYNAVQLNSLKAAIKAKKAEVDSLSDEVVKLDQTVENLRYPPVQSPHAYVDTLRGIKDITGRQLYDFTLWIDLAAFRKKDIRKVEYRANHSSFQEMTATESSNGFSVHFRGAECLKDIIVTITFIEGTTKQFNFNMCKALGW